MVRDARNAEWTHNGRRRRPIWGGFVASMPRHWQGWCDGLMGPSPRTSTRYVHIMATRARCEMVRSTSARRSLRHRSRRNGQRYGPGVEPAMTAMAVVADAGGDVSSGGVVGANTSRTAPCGWGGVGESNARSVLGLAKGSQHWPLLCCTPRSPPMVRHGSSNLT